MKRHVKNTILAGISGVILFVVSVVFILPAVVNDPLLLAAGLLFLIFGVMFSKDDFLVESDGMVGRKGRGGGERGSPYQG